MIASSLFLFTGAYFDKLNDFDCLLKFALRLIIIRRYSDFSGNHNYFLYNHN